MKYLLKLLRPQDSKGERDLLWPLIAVSLTAHLTVLAFMAGSNPEAVQTLLVRSMTFVHEDTTTPIRIATVRSNSIPVSKSTTEMERPDPPGIDDDDTEVVPAPLEEKKETAEEDKMEFKETIQRRAGGKNTRSPLFLQVVRERISQSCEKHVTDQIGAMGIQKVVVLSVSLLPTGELESVEVVKSSNMPVVDKASIEAVKLAAPFPRLPDELKRDLETLNLDKLKLRVPIKFITDRKAG